MIEEILLGVLLGMLAAECCGFCGWAAQKLISCAAGISYGQTSRAHIRYLEWADDLHSHSLQIFSLFYSLGIAVAAALSWMCQAAGWADAPRSGEAMPDYFHRACAEALNHALRGIDLRTMSPARRRQIRRVSTRLQERLQCPAGTFGRDCAAQLLAITASICEAYIDNRDEYTARNLAEAAFPHVEELGRSHPAALAVRRASAYALLQLGHCQQALMLLRQVSQDEIGVFGADDPQTFRTRQLLLWALAGTGQAREAESGFRALEARMIHVPGFTPLLRHVQCKRSWTVGQQGLVRESAEGYDRVIADRCAELGPDHADALDARHSKGKLLVQEAADGAQALAVLRPLLADRRRVQGRRHPDTLETRKYLAVARTLMRPDSARTRRQALRELKRVRWLQARMLAPGHPYVHDTDWWLTALR
ncbi:MAG TPA: hypothetical protein VK284_02580 [Streptosporangiaceae bacterium]|nr:hypothetical protein [Streptosporangiaceae bacterium]